MERLSEKEFQAEKLYYLSMSIAKAMFQNGVIDAELLTMLDEKLLERYHPVIATLLAGKPLTQ